MKATMMLSTAGALTVAGLAQATPFNGFTINSIGDMGYGETYHMYVNLESGARIDAVFGNSVGALSIGTADGMSFYQNALGGPTSTSINSAFFPLAPSLEWDTYVTIGAIDSAGSPFAENKLLDIGIDWSAFEGGGDLETIVANLGMVAEGVNTTRVVHAFAQAQGVDMPIARAVHGVLFESMTPEESLGELMRRASRYEGNEVPIQSGSLFGQSITEAAALVARRAEEKT